MAARSSRLWILSMLFPIALLGCSADTPTTSPGTGDAARANIVDASSDGGTPRDDARSGPGPADPGRSTNPFGSVRPPALPRTSVENLLTNLRLAYVFYGATEFDSLLACDFEFYFSEAGQHIAEKFTRIEEVMVHRNMLNSDLVDSLRLRFAHGLIELDPTMPDPMNPGQYLWTTTLTDIALLLRINRPEPMILEVAEGYTEQLWFRENDWVDPSTGDPIWSIVRWQEYDPPMPSMGGRQARRSEEGSWGQIKAVFR